MNLWFIAISSYVCCLTTPVVARLDLLSKRSQLRARTPTETSHAELIQPLACRDLSHGFALRHLPTTMIEDIRQGHQGLEPGACAASPACSGSMVLPAVANM